MAGRSKWCVRASEHLVPGGRCLFGADDSSRFGQGDSIEAQFGRVMGVRNRHYSFGAAVKGIGGKWKGDAAAGAIPMVSLGGQGYSHGSMGEVVAGEHDAYFSSMFQALAPAQGVFRPWMEMNGSHNAYSGDPGQWVAAWRHLWGLYVEHGDGNLTWVFCPQEYDPRQVWPEYWPGDDVVDWVGLDLYRAPFAAGDPWRVFANHHRKPFSICESGFQQGQVEVASGRSWDKDGSKTGHSLIEEARASVRAHPNTVMYLVWNNIGPIGNDFVDTSAASLRQYREFASDPYFVFGPRV